MPKPLKDILKGVKSSKIIPGSTGSDPGVDYAPKAPNEQEFVKKHKIEKHEDRVGNDDELYNASNVKHSIAGENNHGYTKPNDKNVNEEQIDETANAPSREKMIKDLQARGHTAEWGLLSTSKLHNHWQKKTKDRWSDDEWKKDSEAAKTTTSQKHLDKLINKWGARGPAFYGHIERIRKLNKEESEGFNSGVKNGSDSAEQIDETHKVGNRVKIVKGKNKGVEGHIGEIRHGLFKGAKKEYTIYHGDNGATIASKEDIRKIKEAVNPYAVGMASAMKKTGDKPPLKKSTITKAHDIAKAVAKEDLAVPLLGDKDSDESAEMAKTQLRALANKALHLAMQLNDDQIVEPWVQSKIAVAKDYVTAVHDYMIYGDHEEKEQTAPYDGSIGMTGAPRDTMPSFSADVNTGRVV